MSNIYVPYYDKSIKHNPRYRLYSVKMKRREREEIPWNIRTGIKFKIPPKIIIEKFEGLQKYFEKRHKKKYPAEFDLEILNSCEPEHKYVTVLNEDTPSVFLGIFLKAAVQMQGRKFKEDWGIVCATGDLNYVGSDETLQFLPIGGLSAENGKPNKYKDEFEAVAEKSEKKCLFLYISKDDEINEGDGSEQGVTTGKITVKRFSPENTVEDIFKHLFKPYPFKLDVDDYEEDQKNLLLNVATRNEWNVFNYIEGERFGELKSAMLKPSWNGFFIHGEGDSGKSATAMAIIGYLIQFGNIHAPVWIEIDNDPVQKMIDSKKTEEEKHDEIEKYIISKIKKRTKQDINSLTLPGKKYLIVIDNLELKPNEMDYIFSAIQNIFFNDNQERYLIITSRIDHSKSTKLEPLHLQEINPSIRKLEMEGVALFIENEAKALGPDYFEKIKKADRDKLNKFIKVMFENIGDFPGLIKTVVGLLLDEPIATLSKEISKGLGENEKTIREKRVLIYQKVFSYLDVPHKMVLYSFLAIGADIPVSLTDFCERLKEFFEWEDVNKKDLEIREMLRTLKKYNLIYRTERNGESLYGIKKMPYETFKLDEFRHSSPEKKDDLRDEFINSRLVLENALRNNKNINAIKSILKRMKERNVNIAYRKPHVDPRFSWMFFDNMDYFPPDISYMILAAKYSSNPEVLSLLQDYGCSIYDYNPLSYDNCAFAATSAGNVITLEWILKNYPELVKKISSLRGNTVFHYGVRGGNVAVLKLLYSYAPEIIDCKNGGDKTAFDEIFEDYNLNTDMETVIPLLDWFSKRAPELIKRKNVVYHFSWKWSPEIIQFDQRRYKEENDFSIVLFDWFIKHAPDFLRNIYNEGDSLFHITIDRLEFSQSKNEDIRPTLDYLFDKMPELIIERTTIGYTVFHTAVKYKNTDVLDWLFDKAPNLLRKTNRNGRSVYYTAASFENFVALDWLFDKVPDLMFKTDKHGITIFHYTLYCYSGKNPDRKIKEIFPVWNWFFDHDPEKAKELLSQKDNEDRTVFQRASEYGYPDVLKWLFKRVPVEPQEELLLKPDNNGHTAFQEVAYRRENFGGDVEFLVWFLEHAPKADIIAYFENHTEFPEVLAENDAVLDWLSDNMPKKLLGENMHWLPDLLFCADNEGHTVFNSVTMPEWALKYTPKGGENTGISQTAFSELTILQKQVLHLFIETGKDTMLFPEVCFYDTICRQVGKKYSLITKTDLAGILRVLLESGLIYSLELSENRTYYGLKKGSYAKINLLFEEEHFYSTEKMKEFFKDKFAALPENKVSKA